MSPSRRRQVMSVQRSWAPLLGLLLLVGCATSPQDRLDSEKVAEANANVGIDYMRKGKYDLALNNLHKALRFNEDHVNANWALGITYARLEEPGEADRYFNRAVKLQPRPDILNSYAAFLCRQGDSAQAIKLFQRAADNPRYTRPGDALANAGLCLARENQVADAEAMFRKALQADPAQSTALREMALLKYNQREFLRARAFIQRLDAANVLDDETLLLGARIELALNESAAAAGYLRRYNAGHPGAEVNIRTLRNSGQATNL